MNIGPISNFSQVDGSLDAARAAAGQPANSDARANQPVPGTTPEQENSGAPKSPPVDDSPAVVVELQQDPEVKSQFIVEFLDQDKNVILQVPSQEELNVEHGIAEELAQAAQQRANRTAPTEEGEKIDGNQL